MIDWEDIITKNIIKGMGIEPSKNKYINWNTIFNFVPKYSGESNDGINGFDSNEKKIILNFQCAEGIYNYQLKFNESTPLKEVFQSYANHKGISNDVLKKTSFMFAATQYSIKSEGTIKENNFKSGQPIIVIFPPKKENE